MLWLLSSLALAAPVVTPLNGQAITIPVPVTALASGDITFAFDRAVRELRADGHACGGTPSAQTLKLSGVQNADDPCHRILSLSGQTTLPKLELVDASGVVYAVTLALQDPLPAVRDLPVCEAGAPLGSVPAADPDGLCAYVSGVGVNLNAGITLAKQGHQILTKVAGGTVSWPQANLYVYHPLRERWLAVQAGNDVTYSGTVLTFQDKLALLAEQDPGGAHSPLVRAVDPTTGKETTWNLKKLDGAPAAAAAGSAGTCDTLQQQFDAELPYVLCIDLRASAGGEPFFYSRYLPEGWKGVRANREPAAARVRVPHTFLLPNLPLAVVAVTDAGQRPAITADGVAKVSDGAPDAGAVGGAEGASTAAPASGGTAWAMLSPRQAGGFKVTVTVTSGVDGKAVQTYTHEVFTLQRYFGALRTGAAFVYSPWERDYVVLGDDSDAQLAVAREAGTVVDPELVVAFSTYLTPAGRARVPDLARGYSCNGVPVGIYTGLGVVGPGSSTTLSFLRSVYLGLDFEVSPHVSFTVAGVLRSAEVPIPPYTAGTRMDEKEVWGATRPVLGGALVLNVTPWYFRQLGGPFANVGVNK